MDHYETLGVAPGAAPEIVQAAWLNESRRCDPVTGTEPDAGRKTAIDAAYEVLRDPVQRAAYDARIAPAASGSTSAPETSSPPAPPTAAPPSAPVDATSGGAGAPAPISFAGPPSHKGKPTGPGMSWAPQSRQPASTNPLAVISFLAMCVFPPLALVLAIIARVQINNSDGAQRGKGWTTAVIVIVGTMLLILGIGVLSGGFTEVN